MVLFREKDFFLHMEMFWTHSGFKKMQIGRQRRGNILNQKASDRQLLILVTSASQQHNRTVQQQQHKQHNNTT